MHPAPIENQVSQLIVRARLIERALHDRRPWFAVTFGSECCCRSGPVRLDREVSEDGGAIVMTGYMPWTMCVDRVEIWSRGRQLSALPLAAPAQGPMRLRWELGVREMAALGE